MSLVWNSKVVLVLNLVLVVQSKAPYYLSEINLSAFEEKLVPKGYMCGICRSRMQCNLSNFICINGHEPMTKVWDVTGFPQKTDQNS